MGLIPGICTQCGATLSVDKEKDAMVCPYCNTPFVVEKAIQNFNNTYNITTQNVYIQNCKQDFEIVAGVLKAYHGSSLNIVVPNEVKVIGPKVFENLMIENVTLSNSVVEIKEGAFKGCERLEKIEFPNSLNKIGNSAFKGCKNITELAFPNNLISIGSFAFEGCNKIVEIKLPNNLTSLGLHAFGGEHAGDNNLKKISLNRKIFEGNSSGICTFFCNLPYDDLEIYLDGAPIRQDFSDNLLYRFSGTSIGDKLISNRRKWQAAGLCKYCGGKIKFFAGTCNTCHRGVGE